MKRTTMLLSVSLAMAVLTTACSGGNGTSNSAAGNGGAADTAASNEGSGAKEASKEPYKIKMALMAGPKTPDSWAEKALEEELAKSMGRPVDVQPVFLPDWSELNTKINLLMSAKDTRPGILWTGDTKEYAKWVDAGIAQDVTPSLQKYGKQILDYYRKDTLFYHWDKSGKIFRIPGDVPEAS